MQNLSNQRATQILQYLTTKCVLFNGLSIETSVKKHYLVFVDLVGV
ncbi:hypothetical protein HMPREF1584_01061 [Gardnerella vaginalis JCP8481A]|nr:hypothetical protein HMPREF1585_01081 [Gardnerella vaginalis JCP8481B]EPI42250.1 hypothetical protein HMPREF1584_01061 [Gardnerella vaginalis JCP8481A]